MTTGSVSVPARSSATWALSVGAETSAGPGAPTAPTGARSIRLAGLQAADLQRPDGGPVADRDAFGDEDRPAQSRGRAGRGP